jgi:hypothetical protein
MTRLAEAQGNFDNQQGRSKVVTAQDTKVADLDEVLSIVNFATDCLLGLLTGNPFPSTPPFTILINNFNLAGNEWL